MDPSLINPELPQISQANLLVIIMGKQIVSFRLLFKLLGIVFGVVAISLIVIITARYAKPSFSQKVSKVQIFAYGRNQSDINRYNTEAMKLYVFRQSFEFTTIE